MLGSVISHLAITTFCWFPPDRVETESVFGADLDPQAFEARLDCVRLLAGIDERSE